MLKQGGGRCPPYSKPGGGASWSPRTPSLTLPALFYDKCPIWVAQRRILGTTSPNWLYGHFGGTSTEPLSSEGQEGGPLVTRQNKGDTIPGQPSSSQESAVSTRVSRLNGHGTRATSGSSCCKSNQTMRRAHGRLTAGVSRPPFAVRTINNKGLTDAWNNVNVVVGSKLRIEIVIKSGHLPWARKDQSLMEIGLQTLFEEYWTSKKHELMILGQSSSTTIPLIPDGKHRGHPRGKISLQFPSALLCEPYCVFLCSCPSHPANKAHIGRTYPLIA